MSFLALRARNDNSFGFYVARHNVLSNQLGLSSRAFLSL